MKKVKSSNIDFIHYDPATKACIVGFKNGKKYQYDNMTPEAYIAFDQAKSYGQHLLQNIVGKYPSRKV